MGELSIQIAPVSAANVNASLPQPSLATLADEEEEPPSSGLPQIVEEHIVTSNRDVEGGTPNDFARPRPSSTAADPEKQPVALANDDDAPVTPTKFSRLATLFKPTYRLGPRPTYKASLRAMVVYSPLNVLLVFIPISWALHHAHQSGIVVFATSALAIIPLAALLGLGTEQIAVRTSGSVGGLLNASLGNIVEMIIAGIALKKCDLELIQSSLLGGLLSNLLLVLGMAFVVGGFRFHQQEFQPMAAQVNSSLMTVSVISLLVPAAFHEWVGERAVLPKGKESLVLLQLSRGSAVILILIYIAYLHFQFYSHNHLFLDTVHITQHVPESKSSLSVTLPRSDTRTTSNDRESAAASRVIHLKLNTPSTLILLVSVTLLAYLTSEYLLESLTSLIAENRSVSREFLTLIILPILSNAAEHATAVVVASKGKFDLAMSVAVGSCIQISLFVIPLLILIAWGLDKPLTLLFDPVETICLFFSVLLVKFSLEDGRAHWMSGVLLMGVYVLIALSFWNYPESVRLLQGERIVCK